MHNNLKVLLNLVKFNDLKEVIKLLNNLYLKFKY